MRVLVAGATGQLGQGLLGLADVAGAIVPLVRPRFGRSGAERVARAFPDATFDRVVAGDVGLERWGVDEADLAWLADEVDAVVDLAAETDWSAGDRELFTKNVVGAATGLDLAEELRRRGGRCRLYCYASSIHAAGRREGTIPEQPFPADTGRTRYELSKWLAEEELRHRALRSDVAVLVARVGGLVGHSLTGATAQRNSLYLLADRAADLPVGLLPAGRRGRIDMLPRDVAADLLWRALAAGVEPGAATIVHVCAGESAPTLAALLAAARSLDRVAARAHPVPVPVPVRGVTWASEQIERLRHLPASTRNAVLALRYVSFDRTFERARLAGLLGGAEPLPAVTADALARLTFEVGGDGAGTGVGTAPGSLARFRG